MEFTLCGAPSESFAALKAESGDQRLCLWTPAREDLPCNPFIDSAGSEYVKAISIKRASETSVKKIQYNVDYRIYVID